MRFLSGRLGTAAASSFLLLTWLSKSKVLFEYEKIINRSLTYSIIAIQDMF